MKAESDVLKDLGALSGADPTVESAQRKLEWHPQFLPLASLDRLARFPSITRLCGLYERKLKEINPAMRNITYDISDLYNFMDGLTDLSALVYDPSIHAYLPNDRQWVKQKMFQHLKRLASQSG